MLFVECSSEKGLLRLDAYVLPDYLVFCVCFLNLNVWVC